MTSVPVSRCRVRTCTDLPDGGGDHWISPFRPLEVGDDEGTTFNNTGCFHHATDPETQVKTAASEPGGYPA